MSDALHATLDRLRSAWSAQPPGVAQRRTDLARLRDALTARRDSMEAAISADFGQRSVHETRLSEVLVVRAEIDLALRRLRAWTKPRRVHVGWRLWPAHATTVARAKGVVGIIAPWNYPVNLALGPLVSAIAAGNHVMLKPSELTPRTSAWLAELLGDVFPPERVAVVQGGADVGAAFSALPFDHLLFTGSTAVGRKVLAAAAPNLTPVTLELGGKAPAVVCSDYPLDTAARRIATGKWINAGQTCIGVDYVLVDAARRDALVAALEAELRRRFPDIAASPDYTRIISDAHHARLAGWIDEARAAGIEVRTPLGEGDPSQRLLPPVLLLDPPAHLTVMQEELFGPILPVVSYRTLEEAIARINALGRPLALYPFSHDEAAVARIVDGTLAGGVTVNGTLAHFGAHGLPFGGIGPSGMGALHGEAGFATFSHRLPVLRQGRWSALDWLQPPYTGWVDHIIGLLVR